MILHVDMDAFYASIEQRDDPKLRGRPVVVGSPPEKRGVVAAASYEAREYGIHSAMASATACRLCPGLIMIPPRYDHYASVSRALREIFHRYTPIVEPLALDEAFLDATGSRRLFGTAEEIGRAIKVDVRRELELTASVGVAPNKFLAKLASDLEKPDGFVSVDPATIAQFLDPLPAERVWGLGAAGRRALEPLGVQTIGQLRRLDPAILTARFGRAGHTFWQLAQGIDPRRVVPDQEAKTLSHETTFAIDTTDVQILRGWLLELTEQVARRLRRHGLRGRTIQIKVRFADYSTITRRQTLPEPTDSTSEIWSVAAELLSQRVGVRRGGVRLLGMGVGGLYRGAESQRQLFDNARRRRDGRLDAATDQIHEKFGGLAMQRGVAWSRRAGDTPESPQRDDSSGGPPPR